MHASLCFLTKLVLNLIQEDSVLVYRS